MINKKKNKYKSFIHKIIENDLVHMKKKNIHTRFPPDPNGNLHIGHAKSIYINFKIAEQYQGKCNLRFDDTYPHINHKKYINSIQKDILWLGYQWNQKIRYASQYFDKMYKYAIQLIKKNLAYVDKLKKEEIRIYRGTLKKPGIVSPYRKQTIEENMLLFENMKFGNIPEGDACLRAKIDMQSNSIIMRDPILYRIKFLEHHNTKNQWCIYPTYDFAHCISDAIEGITHSLCTLEFQENKKIYNWILNNIDINHYPKQYEYSRLNLEYSTLSKRKLQILIDNNIVDSWNDPRLPTLSGLRNRGYTPHAIREFCKKVGITKQDNLIEISSLESCIRKELNITAYRTMAILNPIEIVICNIPEKYIEKIKILNHPKNKNMGYRNIIFSKIIYIERNDFQEKSSKNYNRLTLGGSVKLKYSYIITANSIHKDCNNNITRIFCTCDLTNKNKKKYGIIHWISKEQAEQAQLILYNHIFTTKNPNKKSNILSYINKNSKIIKNGLINSELKKQKKINTYQFERIGYFYKNKKFSENKHPIIHQIVQIKKKNNII
ncbi:glutamine--tRNA ligase/YqeY domain fusion protein [Buchnera aphidicola]|uniref:glutamine--tRNA ligase/YqeY domain fusion protein n=1 Tax=Buchnera aphidicola TaxID=9 RepID=UPI0031B8B16C